MRGVFSHFCIGRFDSGCKSGVEEVKRLDVEGAELGNKEFAGKSVAKALRKHYSELKNRK